MIRLPDLSLNCHGAVSPELRIPRDFNRIRLHTTLLRTMRRGHLHWPTEIIVQDRTLLTLWCARTCQMCFLHMRWYQDTNHTTSTRINGIQSKGKFQLAELSESDNKIHLSQEKELNTLQISPFPGTRVRCFLLRAPLTDNNKNKKFNSKRISSHF